MADQGVNRAAGWLPDPTQRFQLRYWDGQRWTDHVVQHGVQGNDPLAAVPPQWPAPQETVAERRTRQTPLYVIWAGSALIVIGSFLPWIKVTAPLLGSVTKNGIEGDGQITLVLGLAVGGLAFLFLRNPLSIGLKWVLMGLTLLIGAIVAFDFVDAERRFEEIREETELVVTSVASGLYAVGLGVATILVGLLTIRSPWRRRSSASSSHTG